MKNEKKQIYDILKLHHIEAEEFDNKIEEYINSQEFLKYSADKILIAMKALLYEHADFLALSFVIPEKNRDEKFEISNPYHLDIFDIKSVTSAIRNHSKFLADTSEDILVLLFTFYNYKPENTILLHPFDSGEYYPITYLNNVA